MDLLLENVDDGVLTLTLNRPEKRNALSLELAEALVGALRRARTDTAVRAILLTGSGRAFCVGGDVKEIASTSTATSSLEAQTAQLHAATEAALLLHEIPKPTVAAVRGGIAGAGLSLALSCDIRIASDTIKMTSAFAKVGLSGDFGGSYFLTKLLGPRARYFVMMSPVILSEAALSLGLVSEVVSDAELESRGTAVARYLADGPPIALRYIKENLNYAEQSASLADVLKHEALRHARCVMTQDHHEGASAFFEKRPPRFRNR
jgi:2-(1,2-epoxy-1,2-dihydrophenyl)acetyl-CoA isomerase